MWEMDRVWLILLLTFSVAAASCARRGAAADVQPKPAFLSDNTQSIYAADPNDSWNRIFRALFTRTVKSRVSDAFPEGAPFVRVEDVGMRAAPFRISKEKFSRIEIGDRAIEPLYPTFLTTEGPAQALSDPRYSELAGALRQAIDETTRRSAIERALMQADVWAAYDIVYNTRGSSVPDFVERRDQLLDLLRQFIRKLALSSDEVKSLKNNYLTAVTAIKLPKLFSPESGWLEIELLSHRSHDDAAGYRRATRVFVKPRTTPENPVQFLESLKHNRNHEQVEAVALVIQDLLLDTSSHVVPSPLFTDVQFRFFKNGPKAGEVSAELQQFELSRRKLLTEPTSGGFVEYAPASPAYLNSAGNDYEFATPIYEADAPIMVPLRTRCAECHGNKLTIIMTYSIHYFPPVPTTRILRTLDHERAFYVARRKEERDDFKSLLTSR